MQQANHVSVTVKTTAEIYDVPLVHTGKQHDSATCVLTW